MADSQEKLCTLLSEFDKVNVGVNFSAYKKGVKMSFGNRGMAVEAARQCAKDRKAWRALVHM